LRESGRGEDGEQERGGKAGPSGEVVGDDRVRLMIMRIDPTPRPSEPIAAARISRPC
jgi:hypothetical protein